jgi:hypothetical protein
MLQIGRNNITTAIYFAIFLLQENGCHILGILASIMMARAIIY